MDEMLELDSNSGPDDEDIGFWLGVQSPQCSEVGGGGGGRGGGGGGIDDDGRGGGGGGRGGGGDNATSGPPPKKPRTEASCECVFCMPKATGPKPASVDGTIIATQFSEETMSQIKAGLRVIIPGLAQCAAPSSSPPSFAHGAAASIKHRGGGSGGGGGCGNGLRDWGTSLDNGWGVMSWTEYEAYDASSWDIDCFCFWDDDNIWYYIGEWHWHADLMSSR